MHCVDSLGRSVCSVSQGCSQLAVGLIAIHVCLCIERRKARYFGYDRSTVAYASAYVIGSAQDFGFTSKFKIF